MSCAGVANALIGLVFSLLASAASAQSLPTYNGVRIAGTASTATAAPAVKMCSALRTPPQNAPGPRIGIPITCNAPQTAQIGSFCTCAFKDGASSASAQGRVVEKSGLSRR